MSHGAGAQPAFPPSVVVEVKRLACERPADLGLPLARFTIPDLRQVVVERGVVATIGRTTIWRWLTADAIKPWRHRTWIFPRDPAFAEKAGPILDLYARTWAGTPLTADEYVISADEKTSIQARRRIHASTRPAPHRPARIEHEYERLGAWAYMAAWDVGRAKLFGRCERHNGIASFDRLVHDVMTQEPYRSAARVFWIADKGSAHRGPKAADRLRAAWPNVELINTPVHASWLNQAEIYFSIVQRKVLTPNDFRSLVDLEDRLLRFQARYEQSATPFEWVFTRQHLARLLAKLAAQDAVGRAA
jgi:hypothetical protein